MAEDKKDLQTETVKAAETAAAQAVTEPAAETVEEFDKERAMKTIATLREEAKAAKQLKKRLDELEAKDKERVDSELSEMDKLKKRVAEYEAKLAESSRREMLRKVADEEGLPPVLAARLVGASEDELRADAKTLLELLKTTPTKPKIEPTLPTNGARPETDVEKRKRLLNPGYSDAFSIDGAKKLGGGVIYNNE